MTAAHPHDEIHLVPAAVEACLGPAMRDDGAWWKLVSGLRLLAAQERPLTLRIAMLLAWIRRQDVAELGYPSWSVFVAERVDWANSYVRGLVRLVESELGAVKMAVCTGVVPIHHALRAPSQTTPEEQGDWICRIAFAEEQRAPSPRLDGEVLTPEEWDRVRKARRLVRLLLGRRATDREVDDRMVAWFRERIPAERLLAMAREAPERPRFDRPLGWDWYTGRDAAEAILGPWREPASLVEAVAQLEALQAARRGIKPTVARILAVIRHERMYAGDYETVGEFVRDVLGVSPRTAQRYFRLGWTLRWYPELEEAVRRGLPLDAAHDVGRLLNGSAHPWLAVAARVGRQDLARAARRPPWEHKELREQYERAIELADRWENAQGGPAGEKTAAATGVGDAGGGDAPGPATGVGDAGGGDAPGPAKGVGGAGGGDAPGPATGLGASGAASAPGIGAASDGRGRGAVISGAPTAAEGADLGGATGIGAAGPGAGSATGSPAVDDPGAAKTGDHSRPPLRVALTRTEEDCAAPRGRKAPREVEEAATWLLETVDLPVHRGFARVKSRDGHRCQNPECGRLTLRVEAHHVIWRRHGGSDDEENGIPVCRPCHLRLIHTGRIRVEGVVVEGRKALLWTWPDRRVLVFRDPP